MRWILFLLISFRVLSADAIDLATIQQQTLAAFEQIQEGVDGAQAGDSVNGWGQRICSGLEVLKAIRDLYEEEISQLPVGQQAQLEAYVSAYQMAQQCFTTELEEVLVAWMLGNTTWSIVGKTCTKWAKKSQNVQEAEWAIQSARRFIAAAG